MQAIHGKLKIINGYKVRFQNETLPKFGIQSGL